MFVLVFANFFGIETYHYADDPITWYLQERIARYREQSDRFHDMAKSEVRPLARNLLMRLAGEFVCLADGLQELP